ncbi:MAG: type II toxin-antitoxin system RelE/ParE family toxin, partial [Planctomycetes bacterium]|nr:type II toxin-antitoxin system RelE/ParE family toxin [Planctomycetota bacterium]
MRIKWSEPALVDLEEIRDYIAKDSEYYATRLVEKIIQAVEALERFPAMGRVVPEAQDQSIRELLVANYRVMYRIETERVLVLAAMHGARDMTRIE